jgi:hypothetical protein
MNQTTPARDTAHYLMLFEDLRRENGVEQGDAQYIDGMLEQWHAYIQHPDTFDDATRQDMFDRMAVGMHETLSIRDMLIVDALKPDMRRIEGFAISPHDPRNVRRMYRTLGEIFNATDGRYDIRHLIHVAGCLQRMAASQQGEYQAQPYAMAAYLEWFANRPTQATRLAHKALAIDEELTLAAIILSAINNNVKPKRYQN